MEAAEARRFGERYRGVRIPLLRELVEKAGGKKEIMDYAVQIDYSPEIADAVEKTAGDRILAVQTIADKHERLVAEGELRAELIERLRIEKSA